MTKRPTSALGLLGTFVETVTATLPALLEEAAEKAAATSACAGSVSKLAGMLPLYLRAVQAELAGPLKLVEVTAHTLITELQAIAPSIPPLLHALDAVNRTTTMAVDMARAQTRFTRDAYQTLTNQLLQMREAIRHIAKQLAPDELRQQMAHVAIFMRPAAAQLDEILELFEAKPYLTHLQYVPQAFIEATASFDHVPRGPIADLLPDGDALSTAVATLFNACPSFEEQLAELSQPTSGCLARPSCKSSLQVRLRQVRDAVRNLEQQFRPLVGLVDDLRQPLLDRAEAREVMGVVLPQLTLMAMWAGTTTGLVPTNASSTSSFLTQQLVRAACMERSVRDDLGLETPSTLPTKAADGDSIPCSAPQA